MLYHIYNANNVLAEKLKQRIPLSPLEKKDLLNLPATYLICFLNDFEDAMEKLHDVKAYLKQMDKEVYQSFKESVRILRKVKYN